MDLVRNLALLVGRILIVGLFIFEGVSFLRDYAGGLRYVTSMGPPAPQIVFPLLIALFIGGGLMIVVGLLTWLPALGFAAFCLVTALQVHMPELPNGDAVVQFGKDLGLAGGFLMLFAAGPGTFALRRGRWRSRY